MHQSHENPSSWPVRSALLFLFLPLFCLFVHPNVVLADDWPFTGAANWGGTGLLEIPTARVLGEGEIRFGFSQADPYRWYSFSLGLFSGLELGGRVTEISNVPGQYFSKFKDRTFDAKYQVFPESRRFPAVAIGVQDILGTRVFPAEYVVFSRQVYPLDFTLGIGHNRLAGDLNLPFLDRFGFFGGVDWAVHDRFHLMAEYNPIEYEKDRGRAGRAVPDGADWPVNFGARVELLPGLDLGVSWQRGDTLGFTVNLHALLGKPIQAQRPDPPKWAPVDRRPFEERDLKQAVEAIHADIRKAGFSEVSVYAGGGEITAEFANGKYLSNAKAAGRVLRILLFHSPPEGERITVVLRTRDMPILRVSVNPDHFRKYIFGEISETAFARLVEIETTDRVPAEGSEAWAHTKSDRALTITYGVEPDVETYLLDRTNYIQVRPGIKPYAMANVWKGGYAYARYDVPFYSNVVSSAETPPDAVRSDFGRYMDRNYSFDRLMIDQTLRLSERTFGRLSGGYLEKMYAGVGGEILTFLGDGRLAVGVEADWAFKREPHSQFDLMDFDAYTLLGNIFYHESTLDLTLNAKFGRFLYGDYGVVLDVSREFDTGLIVGVWYSVTDSNKFTGFNKGYNDKGIYVSVPMRMFLDHDSPRRLNYSIAPWTRDVAASIYHWQPLYWVGSRLMPNRFRSNVEKLKE